MKAVVICPAERPAVQALARKKPLVLVPMLGRSPIEYALAHLASLGARRVDILVTDRPDAVRAVVGMGEAWGIKVEIHPESRELTVEEARLKFSKNEAGGWLPAPLDVFVLDRLPQLLDRPLWESYGGWFAAVADMMPLAVKMHVGMREVSPGVFMGLRTRVAESARLNAPCWLGNNALLGARAVVGPVAVVDDAAYLDEGAEVVGSVIGPKTYVGSLTEVRNSFAWGSDLLNLKNGSHVEVTDSFLMSDLSPSGQRISSPWFGRLLALMVMVLTSPLVLVAWLRNLRSGRPLFVEKMAVRGGDPGASVLAPMTAYSEMSGMGGVWQRWPQLWKIVTGEFTWIGNRPITREQARDLRTEFEQLWLAAPTGLFSLADAMGCSDPFGDEARAHSSAYAVYPERHKQARICGRLFCRAFHIGRP